jgi:response regulator RpfG family c-di-GMP phosphodiesterase
MASQLHDIGTLGIPDRILGKPGPLTAEAPPEQRGTAFDPEIVDVFLDAPDEIERIRARYADADGARTAA